MYVCFGVYVLCTSFNGVFLNIEFNFFQCVLTASKLYHVNDKEIGFIIDYFSMCVHCFEIIYHVNDEIGFVIDYFSKSHIDMCKMSNTM